MKYKILKEAAVQELINEDWEGRSSEERLENGFFAPELRFSRERGEDDQEGFKRRSETEWGRAANRHWRESRREEYERQKEIASLPTKTLLDVCLGNVAAPEVLTKGSTHTGYDLAEGELINRSRNGDKSAYRALELLAKRNDSKKGYWD